MSKYLVHFDSEMAFIHVMDTTPEQYVSELTSLYRAATIGCQFIRLCNSNNLIYRVIGRLAQWALEQQ